MSAHEPCIKVQKTITDQTKQCLVGYCFIGVYIVPYTLDGIQNDGEYLPQSLVSTDTRPQYRLGELHKHHHASAHNKAYIKDVTAY